MTGVVLLWLAALPCETLEQESERLAAMAREQPEQLDAYLATVEQRWEGLPLRPRKDASVEAHVESATLRLQEACARLAAPENTTGPLPQGNPARLQEILSRPEFAQARQRQGDVLQRLMRALSDWLEELLQTQQAQSFATGTRTAVLVLGFAVALFAVLRLRHWRRGPARRGAQSGAGASAALVLDSPGEHLARARSALGSQPREAIREGLLALLSSLETKRLARPDRVKTNRELVGELPGRGASAQLTGEVERLVRWYDRAFYSLEPVPSEDAARFVDEVERLHQGLAGAPA
ncbi:MAG TPA: DUF4129 domain-containing protein [Myxococcaceae bacterium]|nr:DUF4129 domain-containing protein [Myxococcaceae bacterium]